MFQAAALLMVTLVGSVSAAGPHMCQQTLLRDGHEPEQLLSRIDREYDDKMLQLIKDKANLSQEEYSEREKKFAIQRDQKKKQLGWIPEDLVPTKKDEHRRLFGESFDNTRRIQLSQRDEEREWRMRQKYGTPPKRNVTVEKPETEVPPYVPTPEEKRLLKYYGSHIYWGLYFTGPLTKKSREELKIWENYLEKKRKHKLRVEAAKVAREKMSKTVPKSTKQTDSKTPKRLRLTVKPRTRVAKDSKEPVDFQKLLRSAMKNRNSISKKSLDPNSFRSKLRGRLNGVMSKHKENSERKP